MSKFCFLLCDLLLATVLSCVCHVMVHAGTPPQILCMIADTARHKEDDTRTASRDGPGHCVAS